MIRSYTALILTILMFSGCSITYLKGRESASKGNILAYENIQPSWASANGKSPKHIYLYYPSGGIYYDTGRGVYFIHANGGWTESYSIPAGLSPYIASYVKIGIDTNNPYEYNDVVRKKYPAD